jgi:ElaB/YqjD/DUF883 family membrane-anchored ribosome-binding protein
MENRFEEYPKSKSSEVLDSPSEELGRMKERIGQAYEKTASAVKTAYGKTERYAIDHPGTFALVAFGAGIGLGLALANAMPRRHRASRRMALPIVDAVADCARAYLR